MPLPLSPVYAKADKHGHPEDRKNCATWAKLARAQFPMLHGGWTRAEWHMQVFIGLHNRLARLTAKRRHSQVFADAQNDASAIVRGAA